MMWHSGIAHIFIPMVKFDSAVQSCGSVRSYHLDELSNNNEEKSMKSPINVETFLW